MLLQIEGLLNGPWAGIIVQVLVNGLALFIAAKVLDGVEIKSLPKAFMVALVLAFLNATLGTYLEEHFSVFSLKLMNFVSDGIVLLVASYFLSGFKIKGILWAIILAVVLTFLNTIITTILF